MAVVVKAHHPTDDNQLRLEVDDIVYVLEQDDSGWWGGHKADEETTGWFPGTNLRLLTSAPVCEEEVAPEPAKEEKKASKSRRRSATMVDTIKEESEACSTQRRISNVASPQRRARGSETLQNDSILLNCTPEASAIVPETEMAEQTTTGIQNVDVDLLRDENAKLLAERNELAAMCKDLRRQSDVDRTSFATELEVAMQQERQRLDDAARELQSESAENHRQSAEMDELRKQLVEAQQQIEHQRRNSQVVIEERDSFAKQYETSRAQLHEEVRAARESSKTAALNEKRLQDEIEAKK